MLSEMVCCGAMAKMEKGSQGEERIIIKSSFELSDNSDKNEVLFSIYHDKRKVLTVNVQLDSISAVIKRILFECIAGKANHIEYDADPDKGGKVLEEITVDIQEGLQNPQIQQLFDLWSSDSILYVLEHLPRGIANILGSLEYEAALDWVKNAQDRINKGGYIIDNKIVKIVAADIQYQVPPDKVLIEEFTQRDIAALKKRLKVRRRGGSEGWWNGERRAKFLELYEDIHKKVKAKSSDLPTNIQAKFSLRGEKPSDIACQYAAELFDIPFSDYLPHVLTEARRERKRRTMKADD